MDSGNRLARMRGYHVFAWLATVVLISGFASIDLVFGDYRPGQVVAGTVLLAVVTVQHARLLRSAVDGMGRGGFSGWEMGATFTLAVSAWLLMLPRMRLPLGFVWALLPAAIVGACAVVIPARLRGRVIVGGAVVTGLAGAVLAAVTDLPVRTAALGGLLTLLVGVTDVLQFYVWDLTLELDRARSAAAGLAVAEERLRFAADLHDIQGHHLQAIALKGELVTRLIGLDDDAARLAAAEIHKLATEALHDTRDVVRGYRKVNLSTEIDNAAGILASGGIETSVHGDPNAVPGTLQPLFGLLVREGTTNVLRHGRARRCTIEVHADQDPIAVLIRNDGVFAIQDQRGGSGLAGLRERFAAVGGRVEAGRRERNFELRGEVSV